MTKVRFKVLVQSQILTFIGDVAIDVVSGRGAVLFASFDRYGRLTNLEVVSGGEYYFDVPLITLVDHTGTGKGAVIKAITTNGEITDTEIVEFRYRLQK